MEKTFAILLDKIRLYHPAKDLSRVEKAYQVAKEAHEGQLRQSGEPYLIHPLQVAIILADLELDLETIIAGLLHDVVEDTKVSLEDIAEMFGDEVAGLVDGVTKLKQLTYTSTDKVEIQAENYRKMFLAMAKDIRVILIKLADRLHNMRTLEYKSKEKQIEKARETLDIYAPIAHRLGISKIKVDLEDLSLKYLEPEIYYDLVTKIDRKRSDREHFIEEIVRDLQDNLDDAGIHARVEGRPKHFYSIYKKMQNKHKSLDQIYDLFAVRAIVDSVKDCYGALGIIHEMYTPMPGRFKDYIAMPKPNMYQSLHTTLMGPEGEPFEVQIRTWDMHRTAEYGIAAHWKYKEGAAGATSKTEEEKLIWLQKILEWQQDLSDNKEFMSALKLGLDGLKDSVYAFTPKGDVVDLAAGSTPIDFAYQIHSAVGNKMVGARVNGRIVTLDYEIKNGDRVEIITSQNSKGPSRDWLNIVRTTQAKNKISQWFKREFKQENIVKGKEMVEKYAKSKNIPLHEVLQPEWMSIVQRKYGFKDWESVLAAIGHGGLKEGQVVNRLYEEYRKEHLLDLSDDDFVQHLQEKIEKRPEQAQESGRKKGSAITVRGIHDVAVRFSKCCNPVPGDEIIGYITRGRGVSIHRTDCINIIQLEDEERQRLIDAEWEVAPGETTGMKFESSIQVLTEERKGILADISSIINNENITIVALNVRLTKDKREDVFNITVEIASKEQLEQLSKKISQIPGVHEIVRTSNG